MNLVNASFRDFLIRILRDLGQDCADVLNRESDAERAARPDGFVDVEEFYRLFAQLPATIDGTPAGLVLAGRFEPDGLGLALRIARHRATLGEAIDSYFEFQHLVHTPFARLERGLAGNRAAIVVEPQSHPLASASRETRMVFQSALALRCHRALIGDASMTPLALEFVEMTPDFRSAYEAYFEAPVSVNPRHKRMLLSMDVLERRIAAADEHASPYLEELGEIRTREIEAYAEREGGIVRNVRTYILHTLGVEAPTQAEAARQLRMGRRTLQRRLGEMGYDYRDLLEEVRERKARDLLAHSDLSNQQIAYELSYEQPSSFYRAFKRWTGRTPTAYREDPEG